MRSGTAVLFIFLLLSAGCSGTTGPTATPATGTPSPSSGESVTATPTPRPTSTPSPTVSPVPTVSPTPNLGSPFGKRRVYVTYEVVSNPHNQSFAVPFRRAVAYWNNAGNGYSTYPVVFTKTNETSQADIVVQYGVSADDCGYETDERNVGCAPLLDDRSPRSLPVVARIEAGYTSDATTNTTIHELGHILGIEHGEEPMPLMANATVLPELSQPDARNRTNPWGRTNLTYYIPDEFTAAKQSQIRHAFDYFNWGAGGAATVDWEFEETPRRSQADIVISEGNSNDWACPSEFLSCGLAYGLSPDSDRQLEEYTRYRLQIAGNAENDATGWWTAVWLHYATNSLVDGQLPDEFVELSYEDRRDAWWHDL